MVHGPCLLVRPPRVVAVFPGARHARGRGRPSHHWRQNRAYRGGDSAALDDTVRARGPALPDATLAEHGVSRIGTRPWRTGEHLDDVAAAGWDAGQLVLLDRTSTVAAMSRLRPRPHSERGLGQAP